MGAPGAEFAAEGFGVGGDDPVFVVPGWDGEVEEDDVEGGAEVDGVAEGCFALKPVSSVALSFPMFPAR